jgi:hypothetical protein
MRRILTALALSSSLAAAASAGDLILGTESDLYYDDNVYGSTTHTIPDFSWVIAPTFEYFERDQKVDGHLYVRPNYELYFDENRLRGFNWDASGDLSWRPSERTTLTVTDTLLRYRTLRGFTAASATPALQPGRDPFVRNISSFELQRRTSPTGTLLMTATYGFWNFARSNRVDQSNIGAEVQYRKLVALKTSVGGALSYSRQGFEFGSTARHTDYYNFSLQASYAPSENFSIRGSAGPTLVHPQSAQHFVPPVAQRGAFIPSDALGAPLVGVLPSTCPTLPTGEFYFDPLDPATPCNFVRFPLRGFLRPADQISFVGPAPAGNDSDSWTYFADVSVEKDWEQTTVSLSYRRDQGSNSAIEFSTIADTIDLQATYRATPKLRLTFNVDWENRKESERQSPIRYVAVLGTLSATPTQPAVNNLVPVAFALNPTPAAKRQAAIRSVSATLGADYLLTAALKLEGAISWMDQNATPFSGYTPMERLYVRMGLDFQFAPIRW